MLSNHWKECTLRLRQVLAFASIENQIQLLLFLDKPTHGTDTQQLRWASGEDESCFWNHFCTENNLAASPGNEDLGVPIFLLLKVRR